MRSDQAARGRAGPSEGGSECSAREYREGEAACEGGWARCTYSETPPCLAPPYHFPWNESLNCL